MEQVGHYRLERRIGAGGMGEVFQARDLALGRPAAVKLMLPGGDPSLRERLLREVQHSARLQHPGIATFFDGGVEGGRAWLAVEYVDGETLRARLRRGPLPLADTVALGIALLEALAHAHAAGVLHRDLKPENVMLRADGRVKLLDFGLARVTDVAADGETIQQLTTVGLAVGTVGYMPAEQLRGESVDARADLFAVGAILHECLSGQPAFPGSSAVERIAAVLSGERPALPASVPPGLSALISRALARNRDERPASAAAFLRELREVGEYGDTALVTTGPSILAIADFENLSGDAADAWIGSGVAESVGADLARVPGLDVVARERWIKELALRGAGDVLEVAQGVGSRWLLAGGFQRLGPMLRITARLTEVAAAHVVWAEKFDGPVESIFGMQDRLAAAVTAALSLDRPSPVPAARPALSAYECFARGRRLFERLEKGTLDRARELYEEAIALDPAYAPAYAGLSSIYALRFTFTTDPSVLERAISHATRAVELDPSMGDPRVWRGYACWRLGRPDDGLREEREAMALDPTLHKAPYFAATILLDLRRPDEALPLAQRAVRLNGTYPYSWLVLGLAHLRLDQLAEAQYCFEQGAVVEAAPDAPVVGAETQVAEVRRRLGDAAGARACALRALERIEAMDHMYRDTHRGACLLTLGRCALDAGDIEGASAAFGQAAAHLRGRPNALGGGHLLVQALAGGAIAASQPELLDEAIALFRGRDRFNFDWAFLASDVDSLVQLAEAAGRLRHDQASTLIAEARRDATAWERARIGHA